MRDRFTGIAGLSVFAWLAAIGTAFAMLPLYEDHAFLLASIALTLPMLLVGVGLRLARLPGPLVPIGQLAALVLAVAALYTHGDRWFGFVGLGGELEVIRRLIETGLSDANQYAPPVPPSPGLALVTALAVSGCYLLVDLIAVGMRRAPLTGLPLLALYTAPAALAPNGVPVFAFLPGALGYVALLAYDERERLATWGRQVSTITGVHSATQQRRLNVSAVNSSAQRVGLLAVATAAVVPIFFPVLPENLFERGAGGSGGDQQVRVSNPFVDLRRDLLERSEETAMTIQSETLPEYFRLVSLDSFDGETWRFSDRTITTPFDLTKRLGPPPGLDRTLVPAREETYVVSVDDKFQSDWLPSPYAPAEVEFFGGRFGPAEWRYSTSTLDIVGSRDYQTAAGVDYRLTALISDPTSEWLANAPATGTNTLGSKEVDPGTGVGYTGVPESVPTAVRDLALEITEAGDTPYEKAVLLQRWFRSEFEYSLKPESGHSGNHLLAFLRTRIGYCEQFAAAMGVMARYLGIPARVAVGFYQASRQQAEDQWTFTFADMHAWPELYFTGAGWVTFEPTPAAGTDGTPTSAPNYTQGSLADPDPGRLPGGGNVPTPELTNPAQDPRDQTDAGNKDNNEGGVSAWWWTLPGGLLILALVPALARLLIRRIRWTRALGHGARAETAWAEVRDTVRDLRHDWPLDTPRRTARSLRTMIRKDTDAIVALDRIALAVERARFARTPVDGSQLRRDTALVVGAMRHREPRSERIRARLWPRSLRVRYWAENRRTGFSSRTPDAAASVLPAGP